jgi:hypothetical protein
VQYRITPEVLFSTSKCSDLVQEVPNDTTACEPSITSISNLVLEATSRSNGMSVGPKGMIFRAAVSACVLVQLLFAIRGILGFGQSTFRHARLNRRWFGNTRHRHGLILHASLPLEEGTVNVSRGNDAFSLYYRIYNHKSAKMPLVVCHGGP